MSIMNIADKPDRFPYAPCEVCGKPCNVLATDKPDDCDQSATVAHVFCWEHYEDWTRNEIEIPAERLAILERD
jgi:hypothetical protein